MPRKSTPAPTRPRVRTKTPEVSEADAREPRGARRKRETREKLLDAAFRLFAARGVDAVAINEITEAADVGFGSFYNHFASKEAIHEAVVDAMFGEFGETLDRLTKDVDDPAEVLAICVRHTILRARDEPEWGALFLREGFGVPAITRGLGVRLARDVKRGIEAKRFAIADAGMATMLAGGCVMATIAAQATRGAPRLAGALGLDEKDLPSRAAAVILEAFGVARAEALGIAAKPLPSLTAARPIVLG